MAMYSHGHLKMQVNTMIKHKRTWVSTRKCSPLDTSLPKEDMVPTTNSIAPDAILFLKLKQNIWEAEPTCITELLN